MSRRRPATKQRAARLGRPKGRARLVEVFGEAYEVTDIAGKRHVFRVELETVEEGSPEWNLVHSQMRWEQFEARRKRGEVQPGEPRPVKPPRVGRGS